MAWRLTEADLVERMADRLITPGTNPSLDSLRRVLTSCERYGVGPHKIERVKKMIAAKEKFERS